MTDRERMVEVIMQAFPQTNEGIADALIAAGFISLKKSAEWAREACDILRHIKDDEIKCICKERDYFARRAEVMERALKDITEVLPCSVCPYGYDGLSRQCDLDTGTCLENCLRIAEGKLAEERGMKENDISPLCNVYDLCKSELIAGCVQASKKDVQEWWKSCQQVLHPEKSDFGTKEKVVLMITKLLSENSELLEKTEKLEAEVAELRARLEKAEELPCKVGDTVYLICDVGARKVIRKYKVDGFMYDGEIGWRISIEIACPQISLIGDRIFFTRAEAEARLKELQEVDEVEE